MSRKHLLKCSFSLTAAFSLLLGACNYPGFTALTSNATNTPDANTVATIVAQTVQAQPSATATTEPSATFTLTSSLPTPPLVPSNTPGLLPTVEITTQAAPTAGGLPTITASVDTNCRFGPGTVYPVVGALLVGQVSTVHGKDATGKNWYIQNPKKPGSFCWVWNQTTQVSGDTNLVPVIEAPPTPSPAPAASITFFFANLHFCFEAPTVVFQVTNNGSERLRSMKISIYDLTNGTTHYGPDSFNFPFFFGANDCPPGDDYLDGGETGFVAVYIGLPIPVNHNAQAVALFCHERDLGAPCVEVRTSFTFP